MGDFDNLLRPGRIGKMELKNRIVMAPMGSNYAERDGTCGERIQAYYEARAAGGVGLITMGVGAIAFPHGTAEPFQVGLSDDKFIPGLKGITDRVHKHGAKIAIQLQHAGKTSVRDLVEGRELWVPSMPPPHQTDMFSMLTEKELASFIRPSRSADAPPIRIRVMDKADIAQMVEWFAAAAERARQAGFDGVEIHAAHTYIISGFLSRHFNKRDDEYGGSLENRARLMLEVIAAIRARVGADYPVWLRLDAYELRYEEGITLEEAKIFAKMAEDAGCDAVSVSAYANNSSAVAFTEAPLVQKKAGFLQWAAEIKDVLKVPVIAVGRLEPEVADNAVGGGQCDFVALGRKLLADPELANKLSEDRPEDIRPCIYCYACVSQIFINERVKCAVNPLTGHESEIAVQAAAKPGHVVVVGGGPGGMEAARAAALRGHKVTLIERSSRLGGTLFFAALAYSENGNLLDFLTGQMDKLKIDVRLNTLATPELVRELGATAIVIATGAERNAPPIPGAELNHVWSGDELRRLMTDDRAEEIAKRKLSLTQRAMMKAGSLVGVTDSTDAIQNLSRLWMPLAKKVAIIGGGLVGIELAEFLVARGREVVILEEGRDLGWELPIVRRWRVLHALREHGVKLHTKVKIEAINKKNIEYIDVEGQRQRLDVESVVLAVGARPDDSLARSLEAAGVPVTQVGDGAQLGYIEGAVKSGMLAGLSV